jgi:hypothetical protein
VPGELPVSRGRTIDEDAPAMSASQPASRPIRGRAFRTILAFACCGLLASPLGGCGPKNEFEPLSDAQRALTTMKIAPSELELTGSFDHPDGVYRPGEPIGITVKVNKDAYVAIIDVRLNAAATLVFPNRLDPKALIPAGTEHRVGGDFAAAQPGKELLAFIASTKDEAWVFDRAPSGNAFYVDLGVRTHALAHELQTALKSGESAALYKVVEIVAPPGH